MHPCNETDTFFKPEANIADSVQFFFSVAQCIDNIQDIDLWGNFGSSTAQVIKVRIMRCSGKSTCKSHEEIDEFMDKNGQLLFVINDQIY